MKYKVEVSRDWRENGTIEVDAESEDEARDYAMAALVDDDVITWDANMVLGEYHVRQVDKQ